MYPTPLLSEYKTLHKGTGDNMNDPEYFKVIDKSIFWLFWSGIYMSMEDLGSFDKHMPLYIWFILLIFEKLA